MNEVLKDLKKALNSIEEFYYQMPRVIVNNDDLDISVDEIKFYERRFVAQLKSKYDLLIKDGTTGNYQQVNTDLEVIKKYIYSDNRDNSIAVTHNRLNNRDSNKTFEAIITIPDFFIHKQQGNFEEVHQKLVVEVKTTPDFSENDFFLDIFKLNVYVEKYHFQNGIFLIIHNDIKRLKELCKRYLKERFYLAPKNRHKIFLLVKPNYRTEVEVLRFIDV